MILQDKNYDDSAHFHIRLNFFLVFILQEYNDVKVANDAFKEEIGRLHKEREELVKAVQSLGLKPKVFYFL